MSQASGDSSIRDILGKGLLPVYREGSNDSSQTAELVSLLGQEITATEAWTDEATGKSSRAVTLKLGDTADPRKPILLQLRFPNLKPGEPWLESRIVLQRDRGFLSISEAVMSALTEQDGQLKELLDKRPDEIDTNDPFRGSCVTTRSLRGVQTSLDPRGPQYANRLSYPTVQIALSRGLRSASTLNDMSSDTVSQARRRLTEPAIERLDALHNAVGALRG